MALTGVCHSVVADGVEAEVFGVGFPQIEEHVEFEVIEEAIFAVIVFIVAGIVGLCVEQILFVFPLPFFGELLPVSVFDFPLFIDKVIVFVDGPSDGVVVVDVAGVEFPFPFVLAVFVIAGAPIVVVSILVVFALHCVLPEKRKASSFLLA
jgi:hypothetical protein